MEHKAEHLGGGWVNRAVSQQVQVPTCKVMSKTSNEMNTWQHTGPSTCQERKGMCSSWDVQFVPAHKQQGLTTLPMCAHHKFYPSEKGVLTR